MIVKMQESREMTAKKPSDFITARHVGRVDFSFDTIYTDNVDLPFCVIHKQFKTDKSINKNKRGKSK